jgi:hypothetical protein
MVVTGYPNQLIETIDVDEKNGTVTHDVNNVMLEKKKHI